MGAPDTDGCPSSEPLFNPFLSVSPQASLPHLPSEPAAGEGRLRCPGKPAPGPLSASPRGRAHGTVSRRGSPARRGGRPAPSPPHAPAALKPERGRGPGGAGSAGGMAPESRWRPPSPPLLLLLLLTLAAGAGGLEFGGGPGQWARYARWAGAASSGELSFSLRTNATRALLLYLDDGGDCDFLELLLVDGRLRLRFTLSCAEPATLQLDTPVADDRWHMVLLTRDARRTALAVDGEARAAEVRSKRREMQVASDLFVGGIPPDVRLSALTLSTVKYEPPFRGLLANLKLGERPPALLGSQGLRGAAADPLCAPARNPCANGGLCTVLAPGEVGCDCSHTGFGGKFCSEGEPEGAAAGRMGADVRGGVPPGTARASVRGLGLRGHLRPAARARGPVRDCTGTGGCEACPCEGVWALLSRGEGAGG